MSKRGPIIIVDDDSDDQEVITAVFKELGISRKAICFKDCTEVLNYLMDTTNQSPFLILSDINLPFMNGVELKKQIDENPILKRRSIPFVYYSTSGDKRYVEMAYQYNVQGFFVKGNNMQEVKTTLRRILEYWHESRHPDE